MLNCDDIVDLLPWYLNGTLGSVETQTIAAHLEGCEACSDDLRASKRAFWIADQHPEPEILADYACGLPIENEARPSLERHLAWCKDCTADLGTTWVASSAGTRVPDFTTQPGRRWTTWALAASLLVTALGLGYLWSAGPSGQQAQGNVMLAELLPASMLERGEQDGPTIADGQQATLVLVLSEVAETDSYRLSVRAESGALVAELANLASIDNSTIVIHLPAGAWPSGELKLVLEGLEHDTWAIIGKYSLQVR